ncbi:unnamed protein product [Taenia asiatica]|uniref:Uncharacterized protein n=1 Tax=Taenia asiatica TaxID=60517 RepID=A0A0R3WGE3_TAEAS|nr:unnamed protein product [Taenia asiatica]
MNCVSLINQLFRLRQRANRSEFSRSTLINCPLLLPPQVESYVSWATVQRMIGLGPLNGFFAAASPASISYENPSRRLENSLSLCAISSESIAITLIEISVDGAMDQQCAG